MSANANVEGFIDRLRLAANGYVPSAPDLSGVVTVADPPTQRTEKLIKWAVETATDTQLLAGIAAMSGPPPF